MKNNSEINKKIALLLGFEIYPITRNGIEMSDFAWSYPAQFTDHQTCSPAYEVPDFIGILHQVSRCSKGIFSGNVFKKDYHTRPNLDDMVDDLVDGVEIN